MKDDFENRITNIIYDDMETCLELAKKCLEEGMNSKANDMINLAIGTLAIMRSRELRKNELEDLLFEKLKKFESK